MLLLVGLGNPGPEHARNRHNIGFLAVDRIAEKYRFAPARARFHGLTTEGQIGSARVLLLKPTTFMNRSGVAVGEAARFYKLAPAQVVVLYDEIDLAPGKVRVKQGGGSAGHNGIRSIDAHFGQDYRRVRIGVGRPEQKERVLGWVLENFAGSERQWLEGMLDAIADAAPLLVQGEDAAFMSRVAMLANPRPERPAKPDKPVEPTANDTKSKA
jgi:peptidyl-tRNA hydrolase, PTH1 family